MFVACSSADIYKVVSRHNTLPQPCDISANNRYDYEIDMSSQIIVVSKTENITISVSCIILLSFFYFKIQKAAYTKVFPSYRATFSFILPSSLKAYIFSYKLYHILGFFSISTIKKQIIHSILLIKKSHFATGLFCNIILYCHYS